MSHATTSLRDGLARLVRVRLQSLRRHFPAAAEGDVTAVHQARVASRRLREALPVAGSAVDGTRGARRALRRLTRALGSVREIDVAADLLESLARDFDWPGDVAGRLRRHLGRERARRRRRMAGRLARLDVRGLERRLEAVAGQLESADDSACGAHLAVRLRDRARGLAEALAEVGTLYVAAPLHAVRIAAKKLRYALELKRLASSGPVGRDLATLKSFQDGLGRLHDLQILQDHIQLVAARAPNRTSTRALEAAGAQAEAECRRLHAAFLRRLPTLQALAARVEREAVPRRPRVARPVPIRMLRMTAAAGPGEDQAGAAADSAARN